MKATQKILIVDDNPLNLEILQEVCCDFTCEAVSNGEEALNVAAIFQPDIILLDIMMPGINGYQVCQKIRKNPTINRAKIIMVSAKGMVAERLEGYKAGADDYVIKPFDDEELLAKLKVYARLKSEEEASKFKKDFVKLHLLEANAPLANIKTRLKNLLENDNFSADERQKLLKQIDGSVSEIERLFSEVETLSEMESGAWNNPFSSVDLSELVKESISVILPQASGKNIEIKYTVPESAYSLANREQILRTFHIILENAVQFSSRQSQIQVMMSDRDDYHCLTVTDKGIGMDIPCLKGQVGEDNESDGSERSFVHGQSLTIAQHIVNVHNGTIDIDSTKGEGTTVTIRLPVKLVG